jgi:hypothetical protein
LFHNISTRPLSIEKQVNPEMIRENNDWISPQVMDSHQQRKHRRIRAIANVIERRGHVNYKKFLAEMQYHGLRKCVAEEYLEVLKDLGWIKCENEEIIWKGKLTDEPATKSDEKARGAWLSKIFR